MTPTSDEIFAKLCELLTPFNKEGIELHRDTEFAALTCPECDGPSRPHVLWFDECYDEALFRAESSLQAASEACVLIVIGTSGVTNLPIQIGMLSARRGIPILDVNVDDNPFTQMAEATDGFVLRGPAGSVLPEVVDALT